MKKNLKIKSYIKTSSEVKKKVQTCFTFIIFIKYYKYSKIWI